MHPLKTIPEFLCYRYKGVRRIDQILATAVPFGWKCRKYQNWKEVQSETHDKQTLLRFADALLDGGKVNTPDFGTISRIFYNVQRWRKDKEFADEADAAPSWVELDTLLQVAGENPKVVIQKLEKEVPGLKQVPPQTLWELFYAWGLLQMLKAQKVPGLPDLGLKAVAEKNNLEEQIVRLIQFLYTSVGLSPVGHGSNVRTLLTTVCKDLGLPPPPFQHEFAPEDLVQNTPAKTLVIRYAEWNPLQLMKSADPEGHLHLTINKNHEFVKRALSDPKSKALLETMLSAYAEAVQRFPAHKETLEALTACLGLNLQRRNTPPPQ